MLMDSDLAVQDESDEQRSTLVTGTLGKDDDYTINFD